MSTDHDPAAPSGPPAPQRRTLRRSRQHKVLGGVAGGVSEYLGVDVVIIRIAFIVLASMAGSGVLAYIAAWVILPKAPKNQGLVSVHQTRLGNLDGHQLLAIALVGVGAIALFDRLGIGFDGDMLLPFVLIGIGAAVLMSSKNAQSERGSVTPASDTGSRPVGKVVPQGPFPEPASTSSTLSWPTAGTSTAQPGTSVDDTSEPRTALDEFDRLRAPRAHEFEAAHLLSPPLPPKPTGPVATAKPPARVRKRTPFARSAFGMLMVVVGIISVAGMTGIGTGGIEGALSLTLFTVGGFLVVGSWLGRPRGFVTIGVLLTIALGILSLTGTSWKGGLGERNLTPTTVSALKPEYHLMVGAMYLNLSKLNLGEQNRRIAVDVSMGALAIEVPAGMKVNVIGRAGLGQITLFGKTSDGADVKAQSAIGAVEAPGPTLTIDARVGLGALEVSEIGKLQELTDLPETGNS